MSRDGFGVEVGKAADEVKRWARDGFPLILTMPVGQFWLRVNPLSKHDAVFPSLTELTFAVFFGCRDHDGLASDSIGYPIGIEARILTDEGAFINGPGRGELHIRGPMLTGGYLRNPNST